MPVHDPAGLVLLRVDPPDLLDAGLEGLRVRPLRSKRSISCLARLPRTPSPSTVTLAKMSMPGWKVPFGLPSLSTPMSPVRTPTTRLPSISSCRPRSPGKICTSAASARSASHLATLFSETTW
jgi:hypothetical protein